MWDMINRTALHAGVISAPSLTGTGTDDLSVTGSPAFSASRSYRVRIDSTSETFEWSNDGGGTYEETDVPIEAGRIYKLRNAEGELEGINLIFASASGHVSTDYWDFTTTGTVVSATAVAVGAMQVNEKAERLVLHGEYDKGTETGLILYMVAPRSKVSTVLNRQMILSDLGTGVIRPMNMSYEFLASSDYRIEIDLKGVGYYQIYQIRSGSAAVSGLFTCYADEIRTVR